MKIPYFEIFCMGDFEIGLKVASEYWTGEYCVCNFVMEVFRHKFLQQPCAQRAERPIKSAFSPKIFFQ